MKKFYNIINIVLIMAFIGISSYLIYELLIIPFNSKRILKNTRDLFYSDEYDENTNLIVKNGDKDKDNIDDNPIYEDEDKSPRDSIGRLKQFEALLKINEDIKGWLNIPLTNIDYPIVQSSTDDPEYYLRRNFNKSRDRAGTIFLDYKSSVEDKSRNLVLHGHNMTSTDNMFHYLIKYNDIEYYRERPLINFDTIYDKGEWKIFALIKTNGTSNIDPLFDYTKSNFKDDDDFLNFLYNIQIRSVFDYGIDLNEDDQILTLSTCSYELDNYRTVIFARKVRKGESNLVKTNKAKINENPLYPNAWYKKFGGQAPNYSSFHEALELGEIKWYEQNN